MKSELTKFINFCYFLYWNLTHYLSGRGSSPILRLAFREYKVLLYNNVGRDSSVGTATRYGLVCPGIESRLVARFSAPVQTSPGAYPASCTIGTGSFPGVKRPGRGADYPPLSSVPMSWKGRPIPLLPLWASVACYREDFSLLLNNTLRPD